MARRNKFAAVILKGPIATVWACPYCKKAIYTYKKRVGGGTGYVGNSVRNAGQAAVTAHIKTEHGDLVLERKAA